jgi:hypothetical protein
MSLEDAVMPDAALSSAVKRKIGDIEAVGANESVLVPHTVDPITKATKYLPIDKYKEQSGLDGQALKDDLDQRAVLIKSDSDTYLTKAGYHTSIRVDTSKSKAEQSAERDLAFNEKMDELGLSDKTFGKINEKTPEFERFKETPGGQRLKAFNWESPEQAGQNSPDILLRKNGEFEAGWLNENSGPKSLKEIEAIGVDRKDIMLKTAGNNYLPVDIFDARQGTGAAEKQIARLTGQVVSNERPTTDLKPAFYKADEGVYLSKEKFERSNLDTDRTQAEALFAGRTGHSLLSPSSLKFAEKGSAAAKFEAEGLPPEGGPSRMNVNKPLVLLRLDNETLISGDRALQMTKGKPFDEVFAAKDIYIQNVGKNGRPTGNYVDKETFDRDSKRSEAKTSEVYDRLVSLGVTAKDPAAAGLAAEFASFNLSGNAPVPDHVNSNTRDDRTTSYGR